MLDCADFCRKLFAENARSVKKRISYVLTFDKWHDSPRVSSGSWNFSSKQILSSRMWICTKICGLVSKGKSTHGKILRLEKSRTGFPVNLEFEFFVLHKRLSYKSVKIGEGVEAGENLFQSSGLARARRTRTLAKNDRWPRVSTETTDLL